MKDFTQLIDRVIGKKGILRAPSWWVRRIFLQIQEAIDSLTGTQKEVQNTLTELSDKSLPFIDLYTISSDFQIKVDGKTKTLKGSTFYRIPYKNNLELQWKTDSGMVYYVPAIHIDVSMATHTSSMKNDFFRNLSRLVSIRGIDKFLPNPTDVSHLFDGSKVSIVDLGKIDLSKVTDASYMFANSPYDSGLNLVNLPSFSKVVNISHMFEKCKATYIYLSISGSSIKDASYMFARSSVYHLEWYLKGDNFSHMFEGSSIREIKTGFTGLCNGSPTDTSYMFADCIYFSYFLNYPYSGFYFSTQYVTNMSHMFQNCKQLNFNKAFDLQGNSSGNTFNTTSVLNMESMFDGCTYLRSLNLYHPQKDVVFDTTSVTNMDNMFRGCTSLASLTLGTKFFATKTVSKVDFSALTKWTDDTVITSLVSNLYDRKANSLPELELVLSTDTKKVLSEDQQSEIINKGYKIS